MASGLAAGEEVVLSGRVALVRCDEAVADEGPNRWPVDTVEGGVCCFVEARDDAHDGAVWQVARVDEPPVDRAMRALLAAGTRALIADGRCLATARYALRKYGGVFFAVRSDWLADIGAFLPPVTSRADAAPRIVAVLEVAAAALTVAQDAHGHSLAERQQEHEQGALSDRLR
jgi:tartrate dehydratase beta subunit/fumarate hydratase class I family protein